MWTDNDLTLYHGSDESAANAISTPVGGAPNGIDLALCSPATDFGQGFYTTTNLHQAQQWANMRIAGLPPGSSTRAAVVGFTVTRDSMAGLAHMAFVRHGRPPNSDYWNLVAHCRSGGAHDRNNVTGDFYDIVHGPVSLWRQLLVIADSDQVSFHTNAALAALITPTIVSRGNPAY